MLYPFEWQHILVPLLPNDLLEYACAPSPYVVGIHTSNLPKVKRLPIGEVLIVSVDTGEIVAYGNYNSIPIGAASRGRTGSGTVLAATELVKGIGKEMLGGVRDVLTKGTGGDHRTHVLPSVRLTKTFEKIYDRVVATKNATTDDFHSNDHHNQNTNKIDEDGWSHNVDLVGIKNMMLIYFSELFENMHTYVHNADVFDRDAFLASHSSDHDAQRVLRVLMQTQHFEKFLGQRISNDIFLFDSLVNSSYNNNNRLSSVTSRVANKNIERQDVLSTRSLVEDVTSNKPSKKNISDCYHDIINKSFHSEHISYIDEIIWSRLSDTKGIQWRHGYKSMLLIEILLQYGSEACLANSLDHVRRLYSMSKYRASDKTAAVSYCNKCIFHIIN